MPLHGSSEQRREVVELICNSHPTREFTDERIHAATIWLRLSHSEIKEYERRKQAQAERGAQTRANPISNRIRGRLSSAEEKAKRDREELEQRAVEFYHAQRERFRQLAKGPESFPLDHTIEAIQKEFPTSAYDDAITTVIESLAFERYSQAVSRLRSKLALCNLHLQNLKKREACEIILWGNPLVETFKEVSFFEQEKELAINEALQGQHG